MDESDDDSEMSVWTCVMNLSHSSTSHHPHSIKIVTFNTYQYSFFFKKVQCKKRYRHPVRLDLLNHTIPTFRLSQLEFENPHRIQKLFYNSTKSKWPVPSKPQENPPEEKLPVNSSPPRLRVNLPPPPEV